MKRIKNVTCFLLSLLFMVSCGMDDMPEPSETFRGAVIDKFTNEPIQTEQPNGFRIKLEDIGWSETPVPIYFWGKADGTFQNTKVFSSKYIITPVEGAFLPVEGITMDIKGTVEHDFVVTPYVSIDVAEVKGSGNSITVKYTVTNRGETNLQDVKIYVAKNNPNIGVNYSDKSVSRTLNNQSSGVEYTDVVKDLSPGTYYVRVAARAQNASNRYNMSKVFEIVL